MFSSVSYSGIREHSTYISKNKFYRYVFLDWHNLIFSKLSFEEGSVNFLKSMPDEKKIYFIPRKNLEITRG